jgi:serine/threonine protein kinase
MGLPGLRQFEYNELATATDRFSNLFVMDAFGTVYRGSYTNENGMHGMAVKKIEHTTAEDRDVLDDLILISETRHRNLVGLKGWCFTRKSWNLIDFMGWFRQQVHIFLVLELVPNGNLADYLYHSEEILPWEKRYCTCTFFCE